MPVGDQWVPDQWVLFGVTVTMPRFDPHSWLTQTKVATLTPSDPGIPSLVGCLTGEHTTGSWWSHPKAHSIYNTYQRIVEFDDVLTFKLVNNKVTFVHRDLWGPILSTVLDANWNQSARHQLSPFSNTILELVDHRGSLLCTRSNLPYDADPSAMKRARKELERKALLITGDQHTESGTHAPFLESWKNFQKKHLHEMGPLTTRDEALRTIKEWTSSVRLTVEYSPPKSSVSSTK